VSDSLDGRGGGWTDRILFNRVDEPHSLADLTQIIQGIAWAIVNEGGLDA
jgi:hypothetical protein